MARPYAKLRSLMMANDDTQRDLGRMLMLSNVSVSERMNNKTSWRLDEMYAILDRYHVPHSQLHEIFPLNGKNEIRTAPR